MDPKQKLLDLDTALLKIQLNTLYLQQIEWHSKAVKCLQKHLRLNEQAQENQEILEKEYMIILDEIAKIRLQIIFIKVNNFK